MTGTCREAGAGAAITGAWIEAVAGAAITGPSGVAGTRAMVGTWGGEAGAGATITGSVGNVNSEVDLPP